MTCTNNLYYHLCLYLLNTKRKTIIFYNKIIILFFSRIVLRQTDIPRQDLRRRIHTRDRGTIAGDDRPTAIANQPRRRNLNQTIHRNPSDGPATDRPDGPRRCTRRPDSRRTQRRVRQWRRTLAATNRSGKNRLANRSGG